MNNFLDDIIIKDLAEGRISKVITRFPPEPNGYLHIGHAKSIFLNFGLADKYEGECYLRFDDTNPLKESDEYVRSITEDVVWLTGKRPKVFFGSDYFETMYECAVRLIEKGLAYIDDKTIDELRASRGTLTEGGIESNNRNRPKAESLKLFGDMREGLVMSGELILRAKIDMKSPNINMRDPVIYRTVRAHHHRQGDKWCIYPMYDFAHPIEDAIEGVSHSICTLEFEDHRPLYDWVLDNCWIGQRPRQYEFARLNIDRTVMSKRYLKSLVDNGTVDGWDDPRMPTLAGLRRRGYTAGSLKSFCADIGVAKANSVVSPAQLEHSIREELNMTAPRAMVVLDPIKLVLENHPKNELLDFETNPNDEGAPKRKISFGDSIYIDRSDFEISPPPKFFRLSPGGRVRLKNAYIIECTGYETDKDGKVITVRAKVLEGTRSGQDSSGIKVKGVIHWVDAKDSIDIEARLYDYLLLEGDGDFSDRLNPNSKIVLSAKGDRFLAKSKAMDRFQFLRCGYFVRDYEDGKAVFNRIVGLKDGYKK